MARNLRMSLALSLITGVVCVIALPSTPAPAQGTKSKSILLKLDVDFKDPTLDFLLDDREIDAKLLQDPLQLSFGSHELVVLQNGDPVDSHQFDVGPKTAAEIVLKHRVPLAGDNDPDSHWELTAVPKAWPRDPSQDEKRRKGEWVQLFNGKDLSGWRMRPPGTGAWRVENGVLTCDGGKLGHLFTFEDDWTDVHVRMVVRAKNQGSGVCIRAPYNGTPGNTCYHVVIGGSKKAPAGSTIIGGRNTGDVKKKVVPPNTWFTLEVIVKGHRITTKIDGVVVGDEEDPKKAYAKGFIALSHGFEKSVVEFQRIEARDLAPERLIVKAPHLLPKSAGHGNHVVEVIPLPEALAKEPNPSHIMLARAPGGGFKLGWNDAAGGAHITTLDEDLKRSGDDIILPETELRGLAVNNDGMIIAMVFQAPLQTTVLGLHPSGNELFKTVLSGPNGPGKNFSQKYWPAGRLASDGQEFAVHFGHFGGKHQGGCYAHLDSKGKILQYDGWFVSHSVDQALLHHRGHFLTISVGDTFPIGLPFNNRTYRSGNLLYPTKDQREAFRPKTTHLSRMVSLGDDVAVAFSTHTGDAWQAFLVVTDFVGQVKHFVQVIDGIPAKHFGVNLAAYGSDLLLFWTESPTRTGYVPLNSAGRTLAKATHVDEAIGRRNDIAYFANGDVGWLMAHGGTNEVKVVRVKW